MAPATFQRVLFATDFSNEAAVAREEAVRLALRWGASLGVVHVQKHPTGHWYTFDHLYDTFAEQLRTSAAAKLKSETSAIKALGATPDEATILEGEGPVFEQLEAFARKWNADLIVVGSHGEDQAEPFAWGSVASGLVRATAIPVLTVRTDQEPGFQNIMVPVAFSPHCRTSLQMAADLARQSEQCNLHVVHISKPAGLLKTFFSEETSEQDHTGLEKTLQERLDKLLSDVDLLGIAHVSTEVGNGTPHTALLAYAKAQNIDLICMSTLGERGLAGMLLGSTTERVLRGSRCSMITRCTPRKDA